MKIVIPEYNSFTRGDVDMSAIYALGEVVMLSDPGMDQLLPALRDADAVLMNKMAADEEFLSWAPRLKYVGECATGYNNIDVEACKRRGITVTNVPAYSTRAVAQHVFALLLELFSKPAAYNDFVQNRGWIETTAFSPFVIPTKELAGKTIGLLGYGRIGRQTAKIADAFGMNVLAYSRTLSKQILLCAGSGDQAADEYARFTDLDGLLACSDIISVHCPLNEDSEGLCDERFFSHMKKGSYFINTSRGPVVDEHALADALKRGHLAGAGLDVLVREPMDPDCPLLGVKNCIITPHVAWAPDETRQRLVDIAAENLRAYVRGEPVNVL